MSMTIPGSFYPPEHMRPYLMPQQQSGPPKIKFVNPNTGNYERNLYFAGFLSDKMDRKTLERHVTKFSDGKEELLKELQGLMDEWGESPKLRMIQKDELKDKRIVICGSGNTLKDPEVLAEIRKEVDSGALLCACKQAIKFLHDKGFKIDYAVSMDPGSHIACPEKIYKAPGVKHIIASSSDPELFRYLKDEEVMIFHSACGFQKEVMLYKALFNVKDCMGGGYNVINRALAAFIFMGCKPIIMAGVDSGWRDGDSFYVDGTNNRPGVDMQDHGVIDGTNWNTRPDMLASAVALAKVAQKYSVDDFKFLGDVLPAKLRDKDDAFLESCINIGN